MAQKGIRHRTDRMLLAEVVLAAIFIVMLFALYLVPAVTDQPYRPGAWRWIALAVPFFGALFLESRRRRYLQRTAVRDVAAGRIPPVDPEPPVDDASETEQPPVR